MVRSVPSQKIASFSSASQAASVRKYLFDYLMHPAGMFLFIAIQIFWRRMCSPAYTLVGGGVFARSSSDRLLVLAALNHTVAENELLTTIYQ